MFKKVGIIGLGLIGGSLAKALKKRFGAKEIIAYNRHEDVLKQALWEGVISQYTTNIDQSFSECDIMFLCTPVDKIFDYAKALLPYLKKDCIVTDVGSTKAALAEKMASLPGLLYIGGHPMTGAEKFRYQASKEHLFENAYYILTPLPGTPDSAVAHMQDMVTALGAIPVTLSPAKHDHIVAAVSHTPQIVASGLVNMVKALDTKEEHMHLLAAGGFKDTTRIASSSPDMWEGICFENKEEILSTLSVFKDHIGRLQSALLTDDHQEVYAYFQEAQIFRDTFTNLTPSRYTRRYEINVDVMDKPGSVAIIAVLFSSNHINIKNISIINNRERDEGVLYVAFATEEERQKSIALLKSLNYEVHSKD